MEHFRLLASYKEIGSIYREIQDIINCFVCFNTDIACSFYILTTEIQAAVAVIDNCLCTVISIERIELCKTLQDNTYVNFS